MEPSFGILRTCGLPDSPDLIIREHSIPSDFASTGHASDDWRPKVVRPCRMPVHHPTDQGECSVGHHRSTLVFDLIKEADDVAPADGSDQLGAKSWVDQPC